MIRTMLGVAGLTVMWIALWGDASPGTLVAGMLAALTVVVLVPHADGDRTLVFRPIGAVRFVLTFLALLVVSTASVMRQVLSARARSIVGELMEVTLDPQALPVRTIIAHSISLTPGTLTVDIGADGRTLLVHVIDGDLHGAGRAIDAIASRATAAFAPHVPTAGMLAQSPTTRPGDAS